VRASERRRSPALGDELRQDGPRDPQCRKGHEEDGDEHASMGAVMTASESQIDAG